MSEIITVGLDLAKNVFQVHGADVSGRAVLRKKLRRDQVLEFFGQIPACVVAMEACGGAHFWGREIGKLGLQLLDLVGLRLDMPGHLLADGPQLVRVFRQGFEGVQHEAVFTRSAHQRERKTAYKSMFC
jgi:hypothetical protein